MRTGLSANPRAGVKTYDGLPAALAQHRPGVTERPAAPHACALGPAAGPEAGVVHTIETYPARRGWVASDTPVHDAGAAARRWQTLFALLDGARLGPR